MDNCIFCKIISGKCPDTKIEYENEDLVVFKDIRPASDHHFLAVSRKHIESAKCLKREDEPLLTNMENALNQILQEKGVDTSDALLGFHWPPFTSVRHLHMHGIAPASKLSFLSKWTFRPNTIWFYTAEIVRKRIESMAPEPTEF